MSKYEPLFENIGKSLKVIKFTDKDGILKKRNLKINQFKGLIVVPFTDSLEDIPFAIKSIFGTEAYARFIKQYFTPKRIVYKRTLLPSPKKIINTEIKPIQDYLKKTLRGLRKADIKYLTNQNMIVDYSEVISLIKYRQEDLSHPKVLSKIELLIPEILTYTLMDRSDVNVSSYTHTLGLQLICNGCEPRCFPNFDRMLIPYKITALDKNILKKNYLMGEPLPKHIRTEYNSIYDLSLIRFLLRVYGSDYYADNYEIYNGWIDKFAQYNPIFYFYNDKVGFIFDIRELKLKQKKNYDYVLRLLRERLNLLISINNKELDDDGLNKYLSELDEIEKQELGIKTTTTIVNEKTDVVETNTSVVLSPNQVAQNKISELVSNKKNQLHTDDNETKELINKLANKASNSTGDYVEPPQEEEEDDGNEEIIGPEDQDLEQEEEEENDVNLEDDEEPEEKKEEPQEEEAPELSEAELKKVLKTLDRSNKPVRSPKQQKRIDLVSKKWKSVKYNSNGKSKTLEELIADTSTATIKNNIKDIPLRNKSLLKSNLVDFEKSYIEQKYEQDIIKTLKSFSEDKNTNLHILDIQKIDSSDQFTEKETFIVKFEDDNQKRHTLKFDMPRISEDGSIKINGNEKLLRKQIIFLPVVKNTPTTVWLTSYLNRTMIERVGLVNNRVTYILLKKIVPELLKPHPSFEIKQTNRKPYNEKYLTTIEYDDIASKVEVIEMKDKKKNIHIKFLFKIDKLAEELREHKSIAPLDVKKLDNPNILPFGIDYTNKKLIYIDLESDKYGSVAAKVISYIRESGLVDNLDQVLSSTKIPSRKSFLKIKLQSKDIPLIVFLSELFGFENVLKKADIKVTISETSLRVPKPHIRFKDCYLYYDEYPQWKCHLMNGLYYLPTEEYELAELESPMIYLEYLWSKFKTRNIVKGWYSFRELFLDPTTKEILRDLGQPTEFLELFLYAASLLDDNSYINEGDKRNYRLRGYETMVECLYTALAEQYIQVKQNKRNTFTIPQDVIFNKLHKSQILSNKDSLNPLMEVKDKGTVTMKGPSGTNLKQAYNMTKRAYDKGSISTFAMSTVDNGNTGVIKQLVMDPNILSTRGYIKTDHDVKKTTYAQLYSYEEAVVPYIEKDDPSRNNFATIQTSHLEESHGSHAPLVRTGAESILAYKIPETFVKRSKTDGVVTNVDELNKKIYITYADGTKDVVQYGMSLNRNSNFFVENDLVCRVKKGMKLKKDDVIAYNSGWFHDEGDKVVYKSGPLGRVVFMENESTEEDSSIITEEFGSKMESGVVKKKCITLKKNTLLFSYKKKGEHVLVGDPLMGFEETSEEDTVKVLDLFESEIDDEFSADLLRKTPKSNATGDIIDVKIYWTCEISDMHPSLAKMVRSYCNELKKSIEENEKFTGRTDRRRLELQVSTPHRGRINGEVMPEEGGVLVEYFVSHTSTMGAGDKLSFNSSLKSIVSKVIPKEFQPVTESGMKIDCFIGALSSQARMVNSVYINGLLASLLYRSSRSIAKDFLLNIKETKNE